MEEPVPLHIRDHRPSTPIGFRFIFWCILTPIATLFWMLEIDALIILKDWLTKTPKETVKMFGMNWLVWFLIFLIFFLFGALSLGDLGPDDKLRRLPSFFVVLFLAWVSTVIGFWIRLTYLAGKQVLLQWLNGSDDERQEIYNMLIPIAAYAAIHTFFQVIMIR